jgi:hypothetical protein
VPAPFMFSAHGQALSSVPGMEGRLSIYPISAALTLCFQDFVAYGIARDKALQKELIGLLQTIDLTALAAKASKLRSGISCIIAAPNLANLDKNGLSRMMGHVNFHLEIRFKDGVNWLARIKRKNAGTPPSAIASYLIQSEVATYRFLETTNVPAPRVFAYATDSNNPIGTPYILFEKIKGQTLPSTSPTPTQMRKVMSQLAGVYAELHRNPLNFRGSLDQPGTAHVGPVARELLANLSTRSIGKSKTRSNPTIDFLGPFSTSRAYYTTIISRILDLIVDGELYAPWAVDAFLIHRFLLDLVPSLAEPEQTPNDGEQFYLRHADDKGDHILVDEEFNITGIIDWEWAYTAPKDEAFTSPLAFLDAQDFFSGVDVLSDKEHILTEFLDEYGLGEAVKCGRKHQRFRYCVGYALYDWDWDGYTALFAALRKTFGVDEGLSWEEWKQVAMERYGNEERLKVLVARVG